MTLSACYVVHAKNQYFRNICTFSDAVKLCKKHLERSKAKTYDIVEKNRLIKHSSIFFFMSGRAHTQICNDIHSLFHHIYPEDTSAIFY